MSLDRKYFRLIVLVPVVGLLAAGCTGINTSQSISPATFLMPGFFGQVPLSAQSPVPADLAHTPPHSK